MDLGVVEFTRKTFFISDSKLAEQINADHMNFHGENRLLLCSFNLYSCIVVTSIC